MKRRAIVGGLLAAVMLSALTVPIVFADDNSGENVGDGDAIASVRAATRSYRDVDRAVEAGYVQFFGCVHEPLMGSMGIHFVNATLAGDIEIDPAAPEALMYERRPNGKLTLVGVEYVVFQEAWDAEHDQPPTLFDLDFSLVPDGNRYGIPAFYELHAWAWKDNPTGPHHDWNPTVLCLDTEGHTG
jgi:hypothetical protein